MSEPLLQRLDELKLQECGRIERVDNPDDLQRLMAMGVCAGRTVEIVQRGDPLILRVFGSRIGLSARLARHVMVAPCPPVQRCWMHPSHTEELRAGT